MFAGTFTVVDSTFPTPTSFLHFNYHTMAWQCARCAKAPCELGAYARATFTTSTTSALFPSPAAQAVGHRLPTRGSKMTYSPKGKRRGQPAKAKPPEPGERRAFRKRIRLTNPNALPVPNTLDLGPQLGTQPECEGKVMSIPQTLLERLQTIGAFKSNQGWRYYSRPSMLIRRETLELAECVKCIASGKSAAHTVRSVIVGERGSGKSMHILQAMLFAMLKDWIVIHVPEGRSSPSLLASNSDSYV